ncbi:MAG: ATP-binding protein [candidate division KSB1 bacterium]|nr:ATP-binding protein [candidate division KSB1 bacterium]
MWYQRYYEQKIEDYLKPGKVFVLYGLRRTGKTSLIQKFLSSYSGKYFLGSGEDMTLAEIFHSQSIQRMRSSFESYDLVVIDEAQHIPEVGRGLKILVDHLPEIKVIASGSSSFDLSNKLGEPLTGRQRIGTLYPLSMLEIKDQFGPMEIAQRLEEFMIFGTFPEVLNLKGKTEKIEHLLSLRDSYLLKDLLMLENIRNSSKLNALLKLLAFQIGREVSLNELSNSLDVAKSTVERYLDLFEKVFIIKKVGGFYRNLRKEVIKTNRYYFCDNGIRNALINNFNYLDSRDDVGMLWENFILNERLKRNTYQRHYANYYFWRTYDRKEIDFVEEYGGELWGYEFKWGEKSSTAPKDWIETYVSAHFETINRSNFLDFVT